MRKAFYAVLVVLAVGALVGWQDGLKVDRELRHSDISSYYGRHPEWFGTSGEGYLLRRVGVSKTELVITGMMSLGIADLRKHGGIIMLSSNGAR